MNTKQIRNTLLLILTALIWGCAFVAQSVGAEYVGAFTFLSSRSWLAGVVLLPLIAAIALIPKKRSGEITLVGIMGIIHLSYLVLYMLRMDVY